MPFNGSGTYSPPSADFPAVSGTTIQASKFNNVVNDIANALTGSIQRNGEVVPTANQPMGGYRHTNVANASNRNEYAAVGQIQDGAYIWAGTAGGTANALTISTSPPTTAYAAGQSFTFIAASSNTGATTVAVNGLAAKSIVFNNTALLGNELSPGVIYRIIYDGTSFHLLNSSLSSVQYLGASHTNLSLSFSVASNALTISVKTRAGTDPTSGDPLYFSFRNSTAATGNFVVRTLTTSLSLTISSGSRLWTYDNLPARIWVVLFDDAGTLRLGVINCWDHQANIVDPGSAIYPLREDRFASSTAEGGAGGADSPHVFYTSSAVSSKPYLILGYFETTQTTAGSWTSTPTKVQIWYPGIPLPGESIQSHYNFPDASYSDSAGTIPQDATIPQSSEGASISMFDLSFPLSVVACNQIEYEACLNVGGSAALVATFAAFWGGSDAISAVNCNVAGTTTLTQANLRWTGRGDQGSGTFTVRSGRSTGTVYVNRTGGVDDIFGIAQLSFVRIREVMT